jgi:hypothetical protein
MDWRTLGAGAAVATVVVVSAYRVGRNYLKAPQTTDQPLAEWVNNQGGSSSLLRERS